MKVKRTKPTRLTSQKREILAILRHFRPVHPTAYQVYQKVKRKMPHVSLGTVYRNLTSLEEAGFIVEIPMLNEPSRFDSRVDMHFHFRCGCCNGLYEIDSPVVLGLIKRLKEKGFKVQKSNLMLGGFCRKCRSQKKTAGITCTAYGKLKSEVSKKSPTCQICRLQEECLYL